MKTTAQFCCALLGPIVFSALIINSATAASSNARETATTFRPAPISQNSRLWQKTTLVTNQIGKVRATTNSYMELQMGVYFQQNGQYQATQEKIDIVPTGGAQAIQGPHQVYFASDIATAGGSVKMITPDNKQFVSRVLGIDFFDPASGQSVLIGGVQSSVGQVVGDNEVLYADAFGGVVKADVRYTYKKSGFAQEVILRKQLGAAPADYGMGADTRLEILTEFFSPPEAVKNTGVTDGLNDDVTLDFGQMHIGQGHAFLLPDQASDSSGAVVVQKSWTTMQGRNFLIESVKLSDIADQLSTLPQFVAALKPGKNIRRTASKTRTLPKATAAITQKSAMTVAKADRSKPGYNLDYEFWHNTTLTNYTFQCDTTYLIGGEVDLAGTTTFEGGCVVKYTNDTAAVLSVTNAIWNTEAYRPAWFGSMNDDTVGDIITGSLGNAWTNQPGLVALKFSSNTILHDVRFSHLARAISLATNTTLSITNFQMLYCQSGIVGARTTDNLFNGLVYQVGTLFDQICSGACITNACTFLGENLTLHSIGNFALDTTSTAKLTNCLITQVTNLSLCASVLTNGTAILASDSGVFQTVGAASHYLATNSVYRNYGTSNMDATVLADIKKRTTYPPLTFENMFYGITAVYGPQAQRDTDVVDCGYHYDPLDYVFGTVYMTNCSTTLLPGTAIGYHCPGGWYGIWMNNNVNFISQGTATARNKYVCYNTVQEQATTNWSHSSCGTGLITPNSTGTNTALLKCTDWSLMGSEGMHFWGYFGINLPFQFRDCQFNGGNFENDHTAIFFTNCLFDRIINRIDDEDFGDDMDLAFVNNLFHGGSHTLGHSAGGTWVVKDNFFDKTDFPPDGGSSGDGHNGYVTNFTRLPNTFASDVILLASPTYQTGTMGRFYYPSNLALINAGSQSAASATLYHYTTTTNNVIEGTTTNDIGYHYVATDTNGVPLDADGDGVPDYIEDANGNGAVDSGETDWQDPFDLGLKVYITDPKSNSNLP